MHQRAQTTHGPRPGAARDNEPEEYGGRAPHDLSVANDARNVARPGRAEGRTGAGRPPGPPPPRPPLWGGGSRAAPPPPAPAGGRQHPAPKAAPRPRSNAYTWGGCAGGERGTGQRAAGRPPKRGRSGATARTPPLSPRPPNRPASRGGLGPHPPRGRGDDPPSPRQDRGAWQGGWSRARPHAPATCSRGNHNGQANPRHHTRAPHGPRPGTASEHEPERYGGQALHGQSEAKDTRFVACPGKAEGRTEARRPPAPLALPAAQSGRKAQRPPPPPPPPRAGRPQTRRPTPRRAHSPKPGRGEAATGHPPKKNKANGARDRGRTRGRARTAWNGPTSAQHRDRARCARHTNQGREGGGRGRRGSASAHTHKGHAGKTRMANGPSPRNAKNRMKWRTNKRG